MHFLLCITSFFLGLGIQFGYANQEVEDESSPAITTTPKKKKANTKLFSSLCEDLAPGAKITFGGYWENERKIFGEVDAFFALFGTSDTLLFLDFRAIDFKGPTFEGNAGIGVRTIISDWLMLGAFGFFDRKKSSLRNYYNQITAGIEAKTKIWSLTANGYFPIGTTKYSEIVSKTGKEAILIPSTIVGFENIEITSDSVRRTEAALWGFDGEIGVKVFDILELFVGGFYFDRRGFSSIAGPMARAVLDLGKLSHFKFVTFHIEGKIRHDNVRKTEGYIGGRLTLHFGKTELTQKNPLKKRMYDRVRRDLDIVSSSRSTTTDTKEIVQNAQGTDLLVKIATDETTLDQGLPTADVIGVVGDISTTSDKTMRNGQTMTGGSFQVDGFTLALGLNGKLSMGSGFSMQPGQNNTIQQMSFETTDVATPVLSTTNEIGTLIITNCIFTAPQALNIEFPVDRPNSWLNVTNCNFISAPSGIPISINATGEKLINVGRFDNNKIDATDFKLIIIGSNGGILQSFSGNVITATGGVLDLIVDIGFFGEIRDFNNNKIIIPVDVDGVMAFSFGRVPLMKMQNVIGNSVQSTMMTKDVEGFVFMGNLEVGKNGGIFNNTVHLTDQTTNTGFLFDALVGEKMEVFINDNGQPFTTANPTNATTLVTAIGDVTFTP